jgi:hypothetical protein
MNSAHDSLIHNLVVVVVVGTVAEPVPPPTTKVRYYSSVWDLVALLKPTESLRREPKDFRR